MFGYQITPNFHEETKTDEKIESIKFKLLSFETKTFSYRQVFEFKEYPVFPLKSFIIQILYFCCNRKEGNVAI